MDDILSITVFSLASSLLTAPPAGQKFLKNPACSAEDERICLLLQMCDTAHE